MFDESFSQENGNNLTCPLINFLYINHFPLQKITEARQCSFVFHCYVFLKHNFCHELSLLYLLNVDSIATDISDVEKRLEKMPLKDDSTDSESIDNDATSERSSVLQPWGRNRNALPSCM